MLQSAAGTNMAYLDNEQTQTKAKNMTVLKAHSHSALTQNIYSQSHDDFPRFYDVLCI